jgi:hypothetical protein
MLNEFTRATFDPFLHQTFQVSDGAGQSIETTLIEISGHAPAERPFSLIFRRLQGRALPQRIYHVEHAQLGAFELFLVPIGPDDKGMRYQAVFN